MYCFILSWSVWTGAISHKRQLAYWRNIFGIALLKKLTKSETVTGTIFEVHWHVNEVKMTAERPTNSVTVRVDGAMKTRQNLQPIPSDNQSRRSHLALRDDGHSPSQLTIRTH